MRARTDLAVVGAGPAGIAAAVEAARIGLSVTLLDDQQAPGGQIYRAVESVARDRPGDLALLGAEYARGSELVAALRSVPVDYRPGVAVWQLEAGGRICFTDGRAAGRLEARQILLATGAHERPVPIPGWTLPGVMTAGAAQVLLKSTGMIPDGRVALAGSGPLLLLVAAQLVAAGARVAAVLETTRPWHYLAAAPRLRAALRAPGYLRKGLALRRALGRARIPVHGGVSRLAILGDTRAHGLRFDLHGGTHEVEAEVVLLHEGVVPEVQLSRQAGCEHRFDARQRYWHPSVDPWGATSLDGLWVAGDGARIEGARAAEAAGRLAVQAIAFRLGRIDARERDRRAAPWRAERDLHCAVRPLLDRLFPPSPELLVPPHRDTLVCRCEEVTVGELRAAVRLGALGPNQLKAYTRCGMGPCQGRLCGPTVTEVIAAARGVPVEEVGYYRVRAPVRPVTLAELAALPEGAEGADG